MKIYKKIYEARPPITGELKSKLEKIKINFVKDAENYVVDGDEKIIRLLFDNPKKSLRDFIDSAEVEGDTELLAELKAFGYRYLQKRDKNGVLVRIESYNLSRHHIERYDGSETWFSLAFGFTSEKARGHYEVLPKRVVIFLSPSHAKFPIKKIIKLIPTSVFFHEMVHALSLDKKDIFAFSEPKGYKEYVNDKEELSAHIQEFFVLNTNELISYCMKNYSHKEIFNLFFSRRGMKGKSNDVFYTYFHYLDKENKKYFLKAFYTIIDDIKYYIEPEGFYRTIDEIFKDEEVLLEIHEKIDESFNENEIFEKVIVENKTYQKVFQTLKKSDAMKKFDNWCLKEIREIIEKEKQLNDFP